MSVVEYEEEKNHEEVKHIYTNISLRVSEILSSNSFYWHINCLF